MVKPGTCGEHVFVETQAEFAAAEAEYQQALEAEGGSPTGAEAVRRLAVLGQPISHSRSPAMQNAALADLGLADEWSYEAIEVAPEDFADLVRSLGMKASPASTSPSRTSSRRWRSPTASSTAASEISAANTLTFTDAGIESDTDAGG